MTSARQLVWSQREFLLDWLSQNPTPLLRWLRDAGVITQDQFHLLLERSSSNKVAKTLEVVCAHEESSRGFLMVLKEIQGYYCMSLQTWVELNCQDVDSAEHHAQQMNHGSPEAKEKKKRTSLLKSVFTKSKSKQFTLSHEENNDNLKLVQYKKKATYRAHLIAHKSTLLRQKERLMCYSEAEEKDSNSHAHIEIRYTDLFVTEDNESIDKGQHEYFVLASRQSPTYPHQECQRIQPRDLLAPKDGHPPPKRVKVKGIAGIGKSVALQRLLYEWAIGKHLEDFECVFDLRFRELNLIDTPLSLMELLASRFHYLQDILPDLLSSPATLLFVLDGLDEFKFQLDWNGQDRDINVESKMPVRELIVSLIKGNLLPASSVILTTRPSTDAPGRYFQRCCVVLGFQEDQVQEYIYKFYKDPQVAKRVFSYIVQIDNLFVLSFIPLYCYIICSALAEFFTADKEDDKHSLEMNPPKTVSEVYCCYLYTSIRHHALKGKPERRSPISEVFALVREQLLNLGRLAYENLLRNRILFYKEDIEEFGLEPQDIQSTFLSQILVPIKDEKVEMFSFFHLTIQEHLAALYAVANLSSQRDILKALDFWCFQELLTPNSNPPLLRSDLHLEQTSVENLQMFTRFFMGLLRARLGGHLDGIVVNTIDGDKEGPGFPTQLGVWFQTQFRDRKLSKETEMNLFHCLMELHMKEAAVIAAAEIKSMNLFNMKLSVMDCAAMYYVLQFSSHNLEELNVGYCNIGNRGFRKLGPILHRCESLYVRYNCLDKEAAILESAVLKSEDCRVKKLFLCGNNLGPEGVLELWTALEQNTTVEELYVDVTGITEQGTENIVKCLSKNTSLKTLTIVGNDIGVVGRDRLKELGECRPELRIIGNFVDDLGLLQAYLDWVDEIKSDREQLDAVKNADALQSVLKGLRLTDAANENAAKAKELENKIIQLLKTSELK